MSLLMALGCSSMEWTILDALAAGSWRQSSGSNRTYRKLTALAVPGLPPSVEALFPSYVGRQLKIALALYVAERQNLCYAFLSERNDAAPLRKRLDQRSRRKRRSTGVEWTLKTGRNFLFKSPVTH